MSSDTDDPAPAPTASGLRVLTLRRPDRCECGVYLQAGDRATWNRATRTVVCLSCAQIGAALSTAPSKVQEPDPDAAVEAQRTPLDVGVAGGSAQAEFDRRHDRREQRVRQSHPHLGVLILALSDDPQSTHAWQSGATGERRLAKMLDDLGDAVIALHDRRVPSGRANIDHIVIGPGGVYVVDAKRYKQAKIRVSRSGGLLRPAREQLTVAGRDKTKLVTDMQWQVDAVRTVLAASAEFADVPIVAALCFIDGDLPLFGTLQIGVVHINGLRTTAKLVSADGPLDAAARDRLARHLADMLPARKST